MGILGDISIKIFQDFHIEVPIYSVKKQKMRKGDVFELIQYLFHNNEGINQFNILPKLVLLMNKLEKTNEVSVNKVNIEYDIKVEQKVTNVRWNICGIKNLKKERLSEIFFYTGIDAGYLSTVELNESNGNEKKLCKMGKMYESNDIKLFACGLNKPLESGKSIELLQITTNYRDAFDLSHQEILYCYPLNYGTTIGELNYKIQIEDDNDYLIVMREIYRNKRTYSERIIKSQQGKREGNKLIYLFEEPEVNMSSVYYFTIERC